MHWIFHPLEMTSRNTNLINEIQIAVWSLMKIIKKIQNNIMHHFFFFSLLYHIQSIKVKIFSVFVAYFLIIACLMFSAAYKKTHSWTRGTSSSLQTFAFLHKWRLLFSGFNIRWHKHKVKTCKIVAIEFPRIRKLS